MKRKILFVCYFSLLNFARTAPINSNTAFAPYRGDSLWRERSRYLRASDDPSSMDRDLHVLSLNSVYVYGFTEKLTGLVNIPYLDKSIDVTLSDGRRKRGDSGIGDIRTLLKYRIYTKDKSGRSNRLGIFSALEWPTGDDNAKDSIGRFPQTLQLGSGSYDPIIGVVWTTQTLDWEFDADAGYKWNNKANNFEFGDILFYNVSYQHRLWPKTLPDKGVPSFLYAVLELNGSYADKNEVDRVKDQNSGGHSVFISPGVQWVAMRYVLEASVQIPVIQDLNGSALRSDYALTAGFRIRF